MPSIVASRAFSSLTAVAPSEIPLDLESAFPKSTVFVFVEIAHKKTSMPDRRGGSAKALYVAATLALGADAFVGPTPGVMRAGTAAQCIQRSPALCSLQLRAASDAISKGGAHVGRKEVVKGAVAVFVSAAFSKQASAKKSKVEILKLRASSKNAATNRLTRISLAGQAMRARSVCARNEPRSSTGYDHCHEGCKVHARGGHEGVCIVIVLNGGGRLENEEVGYRRLQLFIHTCT